MQISSEKEQDEFEDSAFIKLDDSPDEDDTNVLEGRLVITEKEELEKLRTSKTRRLINPDGGEVKKVLLLSKRWVQYPLILLALIVSGVALFYLLRSGLLEPILKLL